MDQIALWNTAVNSHTGFSMVILEELLGCRVWVPVRLLTHLGMRHAPVSPLTTSCRVNTVSQILKILQKVFLMVLCINLITIRHNLWMPVCMASQYVGAQSCLMAYHKVDKLTRRCIADFPAENFLEISIVIADYVELCLKYSSLCPRR